MSASSHPGAPVGAPAQLGEFRISSVLGEGGSGIVYTAQWGHREVALKVLHPSLIATPRERERFIDEARLLADITHRSVVKVLSFGALPDGRPFLAMEKLDGETLATRLRRGRMTLGEAFTVFGQLVSAIDALHQRGLVHRDLKPENVMLVDQGRFAILLDFGIAKPLDSPASTVTQAGGIRGTPAYMAPERFFGSPASPASDIYELAVVMYTMLVGCLPWQVYTDPEARLNPARPSALGVKLPGTLESELLAALSTRPENRPGSAPQLLRRLELAVEGAVPQRQTADLSPGGQPASPPVAHTAPERPNIVTPEYAATMLAHPTPPRQPSAPAPGLGPVHAGSPAHVAAPVQHPHAGSGGYPILQQPSHAGSGGYPLLHQPTPAGYSGGHVIGQLPAQPTTSGPMPVPVRPIWPTLMVAGSILILAGALLIVFWPRGRGQPVTTGGVAAHTVDAGAEHETQKPKKKDVSDVIAEKLTKALLSESKPKARPKPSGPPPTDMRYLPAEADVVLSARVRDLASGTPLSSLFRKLEVNPRFGELFALAKRCDSSLLDVVERVSLATTDQKSDDFDMLLAGDWTRDRVEACLSKALDGPVTLRRVDALTMVKTKARSHWLAWIDERTFVYSSRAKANQAWMRKRLAKQDSFRDKRNADNVLDHIDQHAQVWLAGTANALSDKPLIEGAPQPRMLLVHAYVAKDIRGKAWLLFADAGAAAKGSVKLDEELRKLKKDGGALLFDSIKANLTGRKVIISGHLNGFVASLAAGMVSSALSKEAKTP